MLVKQALLTLDMKYFSVSGLDEVVKILLDSGADVSATGSLHIHYSSFYFGQRQIENHEPFRGQLGALEDVFPLFAAAAFGIGDSTIKTLLSAGADVNQQTAIGQTALHILCKNAGGGPQRLKFSLDDFCLDDSNQTPTIKKIIALIDNGADVNICDDFGKTPLHYAAEYGHTISAKILLQNGANVYSKDKVGLTALDYAATQDYSLTIALIDKYNFPIEQVIQAYECVAMLITDSDSSSEMLRKATILREEHRIPKTVLSPLDCYGFEKEWETVTDLEKFREAGIQQQWLLAMERISKERNFDIPTDFEARCGK